jgi:hypothetical protein
MFISKYFILETQLTEQVNKKSSTPNWKIKQKHDPITSKKEQKMLLFQGWFPLFLINDYNFPKSAVFVHKHPRTFIIDSRTYCSLFMHPIIKERLPRNGWESPLLDIHLLFSCFTCIFHVTILDRYSNVKSHINSVTHKKQDVLLSWWQWCVISSNKKFHRHDIICDM